MLEWNFFGKLVGYMDCFGKIMCISFDVFGWICLCENVLGQCIMYDVCLIGEFW